MSLKRELEMPIVVSGSHLTLFAARVKVDLAMALRLLMHRI